MPIEVAVADSQVGKALVSRSNSIELLFVSPAAAKRNDPLSASPISRVSELLPVISPLVTVMSPKKTALPASVKEKISVPPEDCSTKMALFDPVLLLLIYKDAPVASASWVIATKLAESAKVPAVWVAVLEMFKIAPWTL